MDRNASVRIYSNHIMFAKDLSKEIVSPQRHQGTKSDYSKHSYTLCLGAFVAFLPVYPDEE